MTPTRLLNMPEAPFCGEKVLISVSLKIQCFISIFYRLEADNQLYVKYKVRRDKSLLSVSKKKIGLTNGGCVHSASRFPFTFDDVLAFSA